MEENEIFDKICQRQKKLKVQEKDAVLVDIEEFRKGMRIYLSRATFDNPVVIELADGQKLILKKLYEIQSDN